MVKRIKATDPRLHAATGRAILARQARVPSHPSEFAEKPAPGRPPPPPTWPQAWTCQPGRVIQDGVGSAGLALQALGCNLIDATKKTKGESTDLAQLRAAVERARAFHRPTVGDFPPKYVRVMGIDPGFANVGVSVVDFTTEFLRCAHAEKITTCPDDGTAEQRLSQIASRLHVLFAMLRPDVVAYENVINVGFGRGEKNADSVRMLEMTGMVRMCCQLFACTPCYAVATASARKAIFGRTPRGTSRSKQDVVGRIAELLGLRSRPSQDVAEAGAVAFGGFEQHMVACRAGRAELRRGHQLCPEDSE
jgi:Holliday junction resolvasome RuvABC endonuclease subunit